MEEERKKDPTFGTKPNEAQFMDDSNKRVKKALEEKIIDPYNKADHLLMLCLYFTGRHMALRGMKEYYDISIKEVYLGRFSADEVSEDIRGLKYFAITYHGPRLLKRHSRIQLLPTRKKHF